MCGGLPLLGFSGNRHFWFIVISRLRQNYEIRRSHTHTMIIGASLSGKPLFVHTRMTYSGINRNILFWLFFKRQRGDKEQGPKEGRKQQSVYSNTRRRWPHCPCGTPDARMWLALGPGFILCLRRSCNQIEPDSPEPQVVMTLMNVQYSDVALLNAFGCFARI